MMTTTMMMMMMMALLLLLLLLLMMMMALLLLMTVLRIAQTQARPGHGSCCWPRQVSSGSSGNARDAHAPQVCCCCCFQQLRHACTQTPCMHASYRPEL